MTTTRPPRLRELYDRWRADNVHRWPDPLSDLDAANLFRDLPGYLCAQASAADPGRTAQLDEVRELLRVAFSGVLSALRQAPADELRHPQPHSRRWRKAFDNYEDSLDDLRRAKRELGDLSGGWITPARRPHVDLAAMLNQFAGVLDAVDRLLAAAEPPPPVRVPLVWAEDRELLEQFQGLLEAGMTGDGELALARIKELHRELADRRDVDVVMFDPARSDLFRNKADLDLSQVITAKPALLARNGSVVLPGEVAPPPAPDARPPTDSRPPNDSRPKDGPEPTDEPTPRDEDRDGAHE